MDDDSPSDPGNGRTFWSRLNTLLFGEENGGSLRE